MAQPLSGVPEVEQVRAAMNAMVGHARRAQLQECIYTQALTNGQEAERARLARELHDQQQYFRVGNNSHSASCDQLSVIDHVVFLSTKSNTQKAGRAFLPLLFISAQPCS